MLRLMLIGRSGGPWVRLKKCWDWLWLGTGKKNRERIWNCLALNSKGTVEDLHPEEGPKHG